MKAFGYFKAHSIDQFAVQELDVSVPSLNPTDILVSIKAIAINPVDYKVRQNRSSEAGQPIILGWDASGVVEKVGSEVQGIHVGDDVYYAGDISRDGCYAEYQVVDHRLVSKKPKNLSFAEAASLPLTALTAWESLFERGIVYTEESNVLIIGGAGGVGSIAIQLVKEKTSAKVFATASRPESAEWVKKMGADIVLNHSKPLDQELEKTGVFQVDVVFCTTHSEQYLDIIPKILRPFGHLCLIDDGSSLDMKAFKGKALSVHFEMMFAKSLHGFNPETQGIILEQVASLVESARIRPTINRILTGLNTLNLREAHTELEKSSATGKIVIQL